MKSNNHIWSFSTVGGVKRVNLESGSDLQNLSNLDPKLWTALSCPVDGLEIDKKTLEIIDVDNDGKIRVPELIEAAEWVTSILKNPDDLLKQEPVFQLSSINENTELGKTLLESAQIILKNLGKENATSLTVEETSDTEKIFAGTRFNGDGIITEDSTSNEELIKVIQEIILCLGSVTDRGGKQGITLELINNFIESCTKYATWLAKKDADIQNILPYGEHTEAAYQNFCSVKSKIDDYFIRCRLAAFDSQSTEVLNLQVARVESITANDLSKCIEDIAAYPLAKIEGNKSLPITSGINPAWESSIYNFKHLIVIPLFKNKDSLTEIEWNNIIDSFKAYAQWTSEKEGSNVESLGIERIQHILSGTYKEQLINLIEQDIDLEDEANNIILVDKLVRYHRDLFTLLKNFVTFFDFYTPGAKAIFQAGTLYIDQRSCDLCIKVSDMAKHATMVSFSGMYLMYCECTSRSTNEKMTIVAALTNGDIDNLVVGKNALFYDRNGLDWDATVIKIVDNPISIRQAFFSPYRKVSRFIETQINKFATAQDDKVTGDMTKGIENVPVKAEEPKAKKDPPAPFDVGKFVGIFAAIGLAVGAIGTAIGSLIAGFLGLTWWKMPIAFVGLLLLISGPSMIIAYLKLRKRNLAPILDANGWAINASAVVNIHFGNTLTHLAELPKGAKINLNDPFTKKKRPILPAIFIISIIIGFVLYLLWKYGYMHLPF
ncbi:MAG: hypothetical protein C0448_03645 [Sphingobacteriaceae bacterium]|nr:hypothetical protein [Sphingobacteriaceae bacterium]